MKNQNEITKKLVKVSPRISVFLGTKSSKEGRDELAYAHSAERSAIGASVQLLPKHLQKNLRKHTNGIRDVINRYSIPYGHGQRIMKAASYPKLDKELQKKIAAYKIFVQDNIIANYDSIVEMSRIRLNGLFREDMFPSKESLAYKYGAHVVVEPLANTDDINFVIEGLDREHVDAIRKNLEAEISANLKEGQMKALNDIRIELESLLKKTDKDDGQGARYNTVIKNLVEKCNNIGNTNVLEIPEIDKIADEIKQKLGKVTSSAVKANGKKAIAKIKEDANDLMSALDAINF